MADEMISMPRGADRDYQIQLNDPVSGLPLTGQFSSGDTLAAVIWEGGDSAALATPSVSWISATAGTIKLTFAASDTSSLAIQPYPVRVTVTHGSRSLPAWQGWLDLTDSPGSSATLPVYCSFADMISYGGQWVKELITTTDRAGFLVERNRARTTLDEWILANYRSQRPYANYLGVGPWMWSGLDSPNQTIKDYLDADKLKLTPKVIEIAARLALSYACDCKLDMTAASDPWAAQARYQLRIAQNKALSLVAEIDTNDDGYPEYTVNLGAINTRWL